MCLAAASYALAASSAVSNVPSHNRAPRFGSRISAAQLLFVCLFVCLLMSALLYINKSIFVVSLVYYSTSIGTRGILPSKKRKISPKKREKEGKRSFFFRTFPTAFAVRPGTPRNTVSWSLFWSTRPVGRYYRRRRPRSKGLPWRSVLRRRQRQRRSGGC